jgi:hypothetical protein
MPTSRLRTPHEQQRNKDDERGCRLDSEPSRVLGSTQQDHQPPNPVEGYSTHENEEGHISNHRMLIHPHLELPTTGHVPVFQPLCSANVNTSKGVPWTLGRTSSDQPLPSGLHLVAFPEV